MKSAGAIRTSQTIRRELTEAELAGEDEEAKKRREEAEL